MSNLPFYEASAQVIPLLVLASAVETRFLENLRPDTSHKPRKFELVRDAFLLPLAVVVMIAGELAALHVTLVGRTTGVEQCLTALAVIAGAFGLATPILNTIIKTTTTSLEQYGDGYVTFARRCGTWTITGIHLVLLALAVLVVVGRIG